MVETLPLHHLARVVSLLARGRMVAYPTGTSYALGVNALDAQALEYLTSFKQRPASKPYSVFLPAHGSERFVDMTESELRAMEALGDRPLTLLVKARPPLKHLMVDGRVGIRTPDHPFSKALMEVLPFPITATSANRSSEEAICALPDLERLAGTLRLYAVDGGKLVRCLPSTVARLERGRWTILRAGDVPPVTLDAVLKDRP